MTKNSPKEYKDYRDPVSEFIETYCIESPAALAPLWKLYNLFEKSELENGYTPLGKGVFSKIMQTRGHGKEWSPIKGDDRVYIRGFELKEAQE